MNDQLMTLSKIFTDRIFRIPDYQRGFAWTEKEVGEFWNDLMRLDGQNNHYVGVLTLEPVSEKIYCNWIDDVWLIESKKYSPYYIVDGQQRLTTSILLIKSIINIMEKRGISQLNYTGISEIRKCILWKCAKLLEEFGESWVVAYHRREFEILLCISC